MFAGESTETPTSVQSTELDAFRSWLIGLLVGLFIIISTVVVVVAVRWM